MTEIELQSPFLSIDEAGDYLRIKAHTLNIMRSRGDGPHWRDHGIIVYHVVDLNEWSKSRLREQTRCKNTANDNGAPNEGGRENSDDPD